MSRRGPPRAADLLARVLLEPALAERLLADLTEEYAEHQRPERGRLRADAWYWRQVLASAWSLRTTSPVQRADRGSTRPRAFLDAVASDVRFAARGLLRSPTFGISATLTLALGIGATTAIFSVLHAVVLRSLPYRDSERIVRAWDHTRDGDITDFSFRVVEYRELRSRTDAFASVGAEFPISATVLVEGQDPQQVQGRMVTADFFEVFGVEPVLGRMFTDQEIEAGDRALAVVSHGFWSRYLGGDVQAVGSLVELDGRPFTLLGVLPAQYEHVSDPDAQVFIPYTLGTRGWTGHWLDLYGRLRPEATLERATDEINAALVAVGDSDRASARWYATVESLHEAVVGDVRAPLWAVFVMVGIVLVLACVNVASLTLARSVSRSTEVAVRGSLGARRGQLLRMLLVESLVVAAVGGATGLLLAAVTLRLLLGLAPPTIPRIADTGLDPAVLAFALLVSATTSIAFGLGPALRSTAAGGAPGRVHKGRGETGGRANHALLGVLVVAEVALTLTLLSSAGLTVRTLRNLQAEEMGFDRTRALTFRIAVPRARYPTASDVDVFYGRLRGALRALPGVIAVGAGTDLPLSGEGAVATVTSADRWLAGVEGVTALQRRATEDLFLALGTPLLEGRGFDERDRGDSERVAVVSASLARALFGEEPAVGRRIGWGSVPEEGDWMTVVGVVADVRYESPDRPPDPQIYQAHPQSASRDMALVVRTSGDPLALAEPARTVLRSLDPSIPAYSIGTLGGLVDVALAGRRFTMTLLGLFAALGVLLTVAGLYGVLSFAVGRRRREIGIRIAVGARGSDIARLVLARGATLVAAGLCVGLLGAYLAGRLLRGLLFRVPPFDPTTVGVVSTLLVGVALAACLVPARGASRVDPVEALRE